MMKSGHCDFQNRPPGVKTGQHLLLTGKLHVKSVMHTDVPSADMIKTRIDWEIIRPGGGAHAQ